MAEGTGRRISAWCNLRWDDVDVQDGTIRWRAETDKTGFEQIVPMKEPVKEALGCGATDRGQREVTRNSLSISMKSRATRSQL